MLDIAIWLSLCHLEHTHIRGLHVYALKDDSKKIYGSATVCHRDIAYMCKLAIFMSLRAHIRGLSALKDDPANNSKKIYGCVTVCRLAT